MATINPIKESWDKSSDGWFIKNAPNHEAVKSSPEMGFPAAVYPLLEKYLGNLQGKRVLVPSSSYVYAPANDPVPNYHWRTQDFVNAIATSGIMIKEMLEFHSQREDLPCHNYLYVEPDDFFNENADWPGDTFDWQNNPWAALPQCLCICSQRRD